MTYECARCNRPATWVAKEVWYCDHCYGQIFRSRRFFGWLFRRNQNTNTTQNAAESLET